MLPSFDPEPGNGLAQLRDRMVALVLAALVGACAAVAAVAFFRLIAAASALWAQPLPRSLAEAGGGYSAAVAIALGASALIAGRLLLLLEGGRPHGPADLIDAAQHDRAPDLRAGAISSLLALNNLAGGASVGVFGPLVHLGGCMAAAIQRRVARMPVDVVLGCGAGAAVAAVFSAPIGAAIFAHEAIIRRFGAFGAGPVLAACFVAFWLSEVMLGRHRFFEAVALPALDPATLGAAVALGVACGGLATLYIHAVTAVPRLARASRVPLRWRPLLPAAALFALSPVLPHLLGAGVGSVELAIAGELAVGLMAALIAGKIVMTTFCLGFGYFGGVFAPALFFGAMLGGLADAALGGGGQTSFALVGAASAVAAVIGAPVAAIVIVFEMTGSYEGAVLSMVSVVVAAQISRAFVGRSLFDRQLALRGIAVHDDHRP
jgi:CIC family chloride channel protein